jgi:hypothetical protein
MCGICIRQSMIENQTKKTPLESQRNKLHEHDPLQARYPISDKNYDYESLSVLFHSKFNARLSNNMSIFEVLDLLMDTNRYSKNKFELK